MVRAYGLTYDIPVTITNCSNNYGPFQFPEKVIPLFTTRALAGEPLPLYASTKNRREWLHVSDHARAIDRVIHHGRPGETYNVGLRGRGRHRGHRRHRPRRARARPGPEDDRPRPALATTGATCSTPPSCAPSSAGPRRSTGRPGSPTPSPGTPRTSRGGAPCSGAPRSSRAPAPTGRARRAEPSSPQVVAQYGEQMWS